MRAGLHAAVPAIGAALVVGVFAVPAGAEEHEDVFDDPDQNPVELTVPDGVCSYEVVALGGAGGGTFPQGGEGGAGSRVEATVEVSPGDAVEVNVGGIGANGVQGGQGGVNGGGNGAFGAVSGGGGGGRSDVAVNDEVVVVAAGGGGGGGSGNSSGTGTQGEGGDGVDADTPTTAANDGTDGTPAGEAPQGVGGRGGSGTDGGAGAFEDQGGSDASNADGGHGGAGDALALDEGMPGGGGGGGGAGDHGGGGGGGGPVEQGLTDRGSGGGGGGADGTSLAPLGGTIIEGDNEGSSGEVTLTPIPCPTDPPPGAPGSPGGFRPGPDCPAAAQASIGAGTLVGAEALVVVAPLALYLLWRRRGGRPWAALDGYRGRLRSVMTMVAVAATAAAVLAACAPLKKVPPLC